MEVVVIHYGELGLKGKNKDFFIRCLINDIRSRFTKSENVLVQKQYGRVVLKTKESIEKEAIDNRLKKVPGIAYFTHAIETSLDIMDIEMIILDQYETSKSFRISARRSNKKFDFTSMQLNQRLGALLVKEYGGTVDLNNPALTYFVEIGEKNAFIYKEKLRGLGGLPLGSVGKVIVLMSGGIDSPVAAYKMIKRGCRVILVHYFNNQEGMREKVNKLGKVLSNYQPGIELYLMPFLGIQREIIKSVPSRFRMLVYRRTMLHLSEKIKEKTGAKAFVTGDSVGQVASQTLENLHVIHGATSYPVLSPLIGFDKQDIINLAQEIGTYEYSILPYSDCCSFMIGVNPEIRGNLAMIKSIEENLELEDAQKMCLEASEKLKF